MNNFSNKFSEEIFQMKYQYNNETWEEFCERISLACFPDNSSKKDKFYNYLYNRRISLAGRMLYGLGTKRKNVTFSNCYVIPIIHDSMVGIMESLKNAALIMKAGGGIGYNFSVLRPSGARINSTGEKSTGPIEFMKIFDQMTKTIIAGGNRRGANIGILDIWHPDIEKFIECKRDGSLTQFNISVAVNDEFMDAVKNNDDWLLIFPDTSHPEYNELWGSVNLEKFYEWFKEEYYYDGKWLIDKIEQDRDIIYKEYETAQRYSCNGDIYKWMYDLELPVIEYKKVKARELYEKIMKSNYDYAEPGVMFIDTVNRYNNLYYIENIRSFNPCGEQPLSSYSSCNLAAINLSNFVYNPFQDDRSFNFSELIEATELLVEALDYVLDINYYPLYQQEIEVILKRPIGIGISGLGDCFAKMKIKYGSVESKNFLEKIMKTIAEFSYKKSLELAKSKGSFILYNKEKYWSSEYFKDSGLDKWLNKDPIRNCRLLTIAPTGTISIGIFNNCSNGIEPIFSLEYNRKVLQDDGTQKEQLVENEAWRLYKEITGKSNKPDYFVTATEISPEKHIEVMAVAQKYVDASISKTINIPEDYDFNKFKDLYLYAYENNLKGCTTYRPNSVISPVMEDIKKEKNQKKMILSQLIKKDLLPIEEAKRYSVKYKNAEIYVNVVHDEDGYPLEVYASPSIELGYNGKQIFEQDRFMEQLSLWQCICRLISIAFRYGIPVDDILKHLNKSSYSIVSLPGILYRILSNYPLKEYQDDEYEEEIIEKINKNKENWNEIKEELNKINLESYVNNILDVNKCPVCGSENIMKISGCESCKDCGWNKCG